MEVQVLFRPPFFPLVKNFHTFGENFLLLLEKKWWGLTRLRPSQTIERMKSFGPAPSWVQRTSGQKNKNPCSFEMVGSVEAPPETEPSN